MTSWTEDIPRESLGASISRCMAALAREVCGEHPADEYPDDYIGPDDPTYWAFVPADPIAADVPLNF